MPKFNYITLLSLIAAPRISFNGAAMLQSPSLGPMTRIMNLLLARHNAEVVLWDLFTFLSPDYLEHVVLSRHNIEVLYIKIYFCNIVNVYCVLLHTKLYCVLLCTFTSLGAPIARGLYVINLVGCFLGAINLVGSFNEEEKFYSSLKFKCQDF